MVKVFKEEFPVGWQGSKNLTPGMYINYKLQKQLDIAKTTIKKDWDQFFVLDGPEGCLTGDTLIRVNRNKLGRKYRLDHLYRQFQQNEQFNHKFRWDLSKPSRVRSLQEHHINLHTIKDVVYSGKKTVYKLVLENGFELKGTWDHKIMTDKGWVQLIHLKDHKVMCDTPTCRKSGAKPNSRNRDFTISGAKHHPHLTERRLLEIHRAIYEAELNSLTLGEYLKIIFMDENKAKTLKYIDPKKYHIHHKDGDHYNNELRNLECVNKKEHYKNHGYDNYINFGQGVPEFVEVESIKELGVEKTYDIIMEEPYRNFCANDIVVHNSGKSFLAAQIGYYLDPSLTVDRVCFSADEFKEAVLKASRYQCIIFDEAYGGLSSRRAMSTTNHMLVDMMAEMRQKNLFVIVVLPTFFDLDKYVAIHRSRCLIHVFHKNFKRGFFRFYSASKKKLMYLKGKKTYNYNVVARNFAGDFCDLFPLDIDAYKKKKHDSFRASKSKDEKKSEDKLIPQDFILYKLKKYYDWNTVWCKNLSHAIGRSDHYLLNRIKAVQKVLDEQKEVKKELDMSIPPKNVG